MRRPRREKSAASLFFILAAPAIWLALFQAAHERSVDPRQTHDLKDVENP
jgi:multisubunit Na+/H+ antiporter MnhG subunit